MGPLHVGTPLPESKKNWMYAPHLPRTEFMMQMIHHVAGGSINSKKLENILYLIDNKVLKPRYLVGWKTLGYQFDSFSLGGVYSNELDCEIKAKFTNRYLIEERDSAIFPNIKIGDAGAFLFDFVGKELATQLGGDDEWEFVKSKFGEYLKKSNAEIFDECYELWYEQHPEERETMEYLFGVKPQIKKSPV